MVMPCSSRLVGWQINATLRSSCRPEGGTRWHIASGVGSSFRPEPTRGWHHIRPEVGTGRWTKNENHDFVRSCSQLFLDRPLQLSVVVDVANLANLNADTSTNGVANLNADTSTNGVVFASVAFALCMYTCIFIHVGIDVCMHACMYD